MGVALYRKYRSKRLDDIVGQEHVTQSLENALKHGTISHAYLLTGPRGVGKTSIARILAHQINNLPYDDDSEHLDIIEIDAASNRRIDEIRDLREKVHLAPTSAKYKVYIIDEVHMLTTEAFNALLKTLEEPPEHAVFILATTEFHKLPETIVSRTQRYSLRPIDVQKVMQHLRYIADTEHITVADDALQLIAEHGDGSFRDSISLLDQMKNHSDAINLSHVQAALGIAPMSALDELLGLIIIGSIKNILEQLTELRSRGYQAAQIAKQLASVLRHELLTQQQRIPTPIVLQLMSSLLAVASSRDPDSALELAILEVVVQTDRPTLQPQIVPIEATTLPKQTTNTATVARPKSTITSSITQSKQQSPSNTTVSPAPPNVSTRNTADTPSDEQWQKVLQTAKSKHNTLYSTLRMATPTLSTDRCILSFDHAFHQKRANEPHNKKIISDCIKEVFGKEYELELTVADSQHKSVSTPSSTKPKQALTTISNIFGDAELLES